MLNQEDLNQLAELLEAELVRPPLRALALRNHVSGAHADSVAECLDKLAPHQLTPDQLALVLRAFAAGRAADGGTRVDVEVVVTGPDAGSVTRDTGVVMRQLFDRARERVLAVGFAVHQGKSVFKALARRMDEDRTLDATLCIDVRRPRGNTSLASQVVRRFADDFVENEWPGARLPRVYYDPRSLKPTPATASALHAKCVVVDGRRALVTSANFTEAAQTRNVELGLLVDGPTVSGRIEEHFQTLIRDGFLERLPLL